jgi:hypothetical protein
MLSDSGGQLFDGSVQLLACPPRRSVRLASAASSAGGLAEAVAQRKQRLPVTREDDAASDSSDDGRPLSAARRATPRAIGSDNPASGRSRVVRPGGRSPMQHAKVTKKPPLMPPAASASTRRRSREAQELLEQATRAQELLEARETGSVDDEGAHGTSREQTRSPALDGDVAASAAGRDERGAAYKLDPLPLARSGVSDLTSSLLLS